MLTWNSIDGRHGPVQLFRPAIELSCAAMQLRAPPEVALSIRFIPLATPVSVVVAGLKMNARSLRDEPSPLMSPALNTQ